jgi:flagellar biosynthetic protein FliO
LLPYNNYAKIIRDRELIMKRLYAVLYFILANTGMAFAAVPETMKHAMKTESSLPSLLNLIISMVVVIALIYFTGWIYQKLSKINGRKSRNEDFFEKNNFKVISSLPLGQQKNLYAVEINDKILVIGATQNNISLIKEINNGENAAIFSENVEEKNGGDNINENINENLDIIFNKYKD